MQKMCIFKIVIWPQLFFYALPLLNRERNLKSKDLVPNDEIITMANSYLQT